MVYPEKEGKERVIYVAVISVRWLRIGKKERLFSSIADFPEKTKRMKFFGLFLVDLAIAMKETMLLVATMRKKRVGELIC